MSMEEYYNLVFLILSGVVGLCVGSFLNVVIYRVPNHMSLSKEPSHCPKCGYYLKWYDNIPVLSFLMLHGKCRNCHEPISPRYTIVEASNCILWLVCALMNPGDYVTAGLYMLVTSVSICIFFIDLENLIIPDRFQLILLACGMVLTALDYRNWLSHVIGGAAGFLLFLLVGLIVSKVKHAEALGGGDVKLAGVAGLILGWDKLLFMVLVSSVAACVGILLQSSKNKKCLPEHDTENIETVEEPEKAQPMFPFGPYLSAGLLISLLFGSQIIDAYLDFFLNLFA